MNAKDRAECASLLAQALVCMRNVTANCNAVIEKIHNDYGGVMPKHINLIKAYIHDKLDVRDTLDLIDNKLSPLLASPPEEWASKQTSEVDELDG